MTVKRFETDFAGKKLIIEHGRMGGQADGAVTVQMGETVVMATVTMAKNARMGMNFFPLMVDYEERWFAAGAIKGPRFTRREGRPSTLSVLTSRMIDRGLRPLFPNGMRNDVQIICMPLCIDNENKPDIVAMIAACTALHISRVPFDGPIVGVRIGMINGHPVVNPTVDELEYSDMQLLVMGDGERITMVDASSSNLPDQDVQAGFEVAMEAMGPLAKFLDKVRSEIGVEKAKDDELAWSVSMSEDEKKDVEVLKKACLPHLDKFLFNNPKGSKGERKVILAELKQMLVDEFKVKLVTDKRDQDGTEKYIKKLLDGFFYEFMEEQVTMAILDKDQRVDGRKMDEIRTLTSEVSILPRAHGTGLFTRGETQVLSVATLGAPGDDLIVEDLEHDLHRKYFHHYNFLPFSVGETKPLRGASRRDIGHGALAEKGLLPVLPDLEDFPYTIRVVSEVMSSNGSSSMGATCGSTLALMDAGVPISSPVAGMAMGMASDGKRWKILTDLQDMEDGAGGMDFKFTGTRNGLTALQMDTKTRGVGLDIIEATFTQVRKGINECLDVIEKVIPEPRGELSGYAPRIINFKIDPEKIGDVIGPGGKIIRGLQDEFEVQIDIEDSGMVMVTSTDAEKAKNAESTIRDIVKVIEVGEVYDNAEVVKIMNFGAFINLTPGKDGFLHVSEIDWTHVDKVTDRIKLGDKLTVKVTKIDRGKVDVSLKALLPKPEGYVERPRRPPPSRGGDRRGGPSRGHSNDRRDGGRPPKRNYDGDGGDSGEKRKPAERFRD